jgi:hypothetical protein
MHNATGIPIVRPEVQLLYMAKAMEDKNLRDFETARPELGDDDAHWLADALSVTLPDHPWIRALRWLHRPTAVSVVLVRHQTTAVGTPPRAYVNSRPRSSANPTMAPWSDSPWSDRLEVNRTSK